MGAVAVAASGGSPADCCAPGHPPPPPPTSAALTPLYEHLCGELGLPKDEAKVKSMRATNEAKLAEVRASRVAGRGEGQRGIGQPLPRRRMRPGRATHAAAQPARRPPPPTPPPLPPRPRSWRRR
jgi:hypothetical protein